MFNRHCRGQTSNLPNSELKRTFELAGFLGKNIIHLFELMKRSSLPQSRSLTFRIRLKQTGNVLVVKFAHLSLSHTEVRRFVRSKSM